MPEITRDDNHIYRVDGIVRPNASMILDTFFEPCPFYTEEGRENGHKRHQWYAFLSEGNVSDHEPEPQIAGAVEGYKTFMKEVKPKLVFVEQPFYHPTLHYCGTPDAVFEINGRLAVVDDKPKSKNKRTKVQTALYFSMLRANKIMVMDRFELRLYDGLYRLDKHTDPGDIPRAELMAAAYQAAQHYK